MDPCDQAPSWWVAPECGRRVAEFYCSSFRKRRSEIVQRASVPFAMEGAPLGRVPMPIFSMKFRNGPTMSIGIGNTIVEFYSPPIPVSVCGARSRIATGILPRILAGLLSVYDDWNPASAWTGGLPPACGWQLSDYPRRVGQKCATARHKSLQPQTPGRNFYLGSPCRITRTQTQAPRNRWREDRRASTSKPRARYRPQPEQR